MGKVIELLGALTTFAGLALFGVSMGTIKWFSTTSLDYGLFMICSVESSSSCRDPGFDVTDASIFFPKVFMIGAAGFLGLGLLFHTCSFCAESKTRGCCLSAGATFYIIGAILTACAPAILLGFNQIPADITNAVSTLFSVTTNVTGGIVYGYSFYLAWAAAALVFIGAIIDCVASCTTSDDRVAPQQGVVWSTGAPQTRVILTDSAQQQAATGQANYYLPA